ncbi:MAG: UDP-N-acetylglucosamine 1-carboxyvinyltransferase [Planctomycetes bacterium]|nr:UDP-N-acetylglucosamine 1-carboxyvinyltransferase [Planctomycetota bacterium]
MNHSKSPHRSGGSHDLGGTHSGATGIPGFRLSRSRLSGEVQVSGAKNSALRLLAASILTADPVRLLNYPAGLLDAQVHVEMLECLGKTCETTTDAILIQEEAPPAARLDYHGRSIRNTLLVLGALTARLGQGAVPLPGGCKLGERKYDLHVHVLESLGARVWEEDDMLCAEACDGQLQGADITLALRSTGATENAILAGSLARGTTRLWNPHVRPEILDLIALLREMGARITVRGQESIVIEGVEGLGGARHRVIPDNVEALTWLVGAVITGGDVEIVGFPFDHLEIPLIHLRESGARFFRGEDRVIVRGGTCYPLDLSTGPYPGINSDMQPLLAVYGALAQGETRITDLRFPGRYGYVEELARMGMRYKVVGDMLRVHGGTSLRGAEVKALDLRAGIALVLAGLTAEGETMITDSWQIERGYDRFVDKIQGLAGRLRVG